MYTEALLDFFTGNDKRGIEVNFCDLYDEEKLNSLINEKTKLVWFESPSNPRINIFDIAKYADIVHKSNAYLVADGTFTSPFITRHLEHGVDIVFHSTTKYIGGHSDTLGGVVTTNNEKVWEVLFEYQKQAVQLCRHSMLTSAKEVCIL